MRNRSLRSLFVGLLFLVVVAGLCAVSFAQIGISIRFGPPPLPVYEQPPCPAEGYIWTPGYWNYDYDFADYYWVPGTWVMAPRPGYLWTPAYWGWGGDRFVFHDGYWGERVGFYGGINYGFGYFGEGYEGGRWDRDRFFYNRSVNNVNVTNIHNVYNTTIIHNTTVINRVSYNGGNGGVNARPRPEEEAAERERHIPPVAAQMQHVQAARTDVQLRASTNRGKPPVAATARPGELRDRSAVPAREAGGTYIPPANRGEGEARGNGSVPRPGNNPARPENNTARPENNNRPENTPRPENNVPRPGNNPSQPGNNSGRGENNAPRPDNNVPRPAVHPRDLPAYQKPAAPISGNPKIDQKYQQQQDKLSAKQDQQRQKLQQKQDQEHQRLEQKKADDARKQQTEQKHQQQTQRLEQKQQKDLQKLQSKEQPRHANPPSPPSPPKPQPEPR